MMWVGTIQYDILTPRTRSAAAVPSGGDCSGRSATRQRYFFRKTFLHVYAYIPTYICTSPKEFPNKRPFNRV